MASNRRIKGKVIQARTGGRFVSAALETPAQAAMVRAERQIGLRTAGQDARIRPQNTTELAAERAQTAKSLRRVGWARTLYYKVLDREVDVCEDGFRLEGLIR